MMDIFLLALKILLGLVGIFVVMRMWFIFCDWKNRK